MEGKDILALLGGLTVCGLLILWLISSPIVLVAGADATPTPTPTPSSPTPSSGSRGIAHNYVVEKGDTLWDISERKEHYDDPFLWPLIHQEASDVPEIIDPDLILPNQQLVIRPVKPATTTTRTLQPGETRSLLVSPDEIQRAENFARTRGPWSLYDGK